MLTLELGARSVGLDLVDTTDVELGHNFDNRLCGETTLMLKIIIITSESWKQAFSPMSCRQNDLLLRGHQSRIQNTIFGSVTDAPSSLA